MSTFAISVATPRPTAPVSVAATRATTSASLSAFGSAIFFLSAAVNWKKTKN